MPDFATLLPMIVLLMAIGAFAGVIAGLLGVGGGIVWDSTAEDEYAECKLKAGVLRQKRPFFSLLESLLWEPKDGYLLLDHHLDRLRDSAQYFGYPTVGLATPNPYSRGMALPCPMTHNFLCPTKAQRTVFR